MVHLLPLLRKLTMACGRLNLSAALALVLLPSAGLAATTYYVNNGMSDYTGHDGSTSALALQRIQEAINKATSGDTILVAPGVYGDDQGLGRTGSAISTTGHWWGSSRICVTKSLHIKSTDGAAVTHIVGAHDPDVASGLGDKAVRCIDVESETAEVVFEGFTLRDGATRSNADSHPSGRGGALFCSSTGHNVIKGKTFLVDCIVSNCTGGAEASLSWGGTFVRCRVQDNAFNRHVFGGTPERFVAQDTVFFNTLFFRNRVVEMETQETVRNGAIVFKTGGLFVNCTFARNAALFYPFSTSYFYNTLVSSTDFPAGGAAHENRVDDTTATRNLIAPAFGDVRLRAGAPAATAGNASYVADMELVPFPTLFTIDRFKDLYGADIPTSGTIAAGCAQATVTPSAGAVIAGDEYTHLDEDATIQYAASYAYPTEARSTFRLWCELEDGARVSRVRTVQTLNGQSTTVADVILPSGGGEINVTPPTDAASTLTVTFTRTEDVRYADPTVTESAEQDGSAEKPYRTLKQAIESLNGAAGLIIANPGVYDSGEMSTGDDYDVKARAVLPNGVILAARDGWTNTFIRGAACQAADQDKLNEDSLNTYITGLGKSAVRGVFLLGENAAVCGFTITNCYVRGATDSGEGGHNNYDYHGAGVVGRGRAERCRFVDCHAFRGGASFLTTMINCLFERNTALYGGGATDSSKHYGCLSRENLAAGTWTAADGFFYWDAIENCTLLDARTGGPKDAKVAIKNTLVLSKLGKGDIADDAITSSLFSHCAFANDVEGEQTSRFKSYITAGDGNILTSSDALKLDAEGRPVVGACAAIDAGDAALNSGYIGETDLLGGQRIYNAKLDIGAVESDARPAFAKAIGQSRVTVTEASASVYTNADDKVVLTDGSRLVGTLSDAVGQHYLIKVRVTSNGTLTVTAGGKTTVCTADTEIRFVSTDTTRTLVLAYSGAGEAVIENLKYDGGMLVIVR